MRQMSTRVAIFGSTLLMLSISALYVLAFSPGASGHQEDTPTPSLEERVSALETQVAILQTQVASSPAATAAVTHDVELSITIEGTRNIRFANGTCDGRNGYEDLTVGAAITVMDQAGVIIARGTLDDADGVGSTCTLFGTIPDVPETAFYQFQVGQRDGPSYSLADMQASGWTVDLSIGN